MRYLFLFILSMAFLLVAGCVIQFIPETGEEETLLVVDGMITDQHRTNKINISSSIPLGETLITIPVRGCKVKITDENGIEYDLKETSPGTYITDSTMFCGHINGRYSLSITDKYRTYVTDPTEMKPVPPIDSVYYEKVLITESDEPGRIVEGCQIYIDSHDPLKECLYFRWNFTETWEFQLPYPVPNRVCWKSVNSDMILIKNTSVYNLAKVTRFPVKYITTETERLKVKYSILVNQYSLNEDEFIFWEKVKNVSENVGGLYDVTPMSIRGNIYCLNNPDETVLGYFSVSAVTQKRIFIDDTFMGLPNFYSFCPGDTIWGRGPIEGIGVYRWVIEDHAYEVPPWRLTTDYEQCADCTVKGTNIKPVFWDE